MGHQEQKHGSPRDDQLLRRHASRLDHSWRVYDHPYTITKKQLITRCRQIVGCDSHRRFHDYRCPPGIVITISATAPKSFTMTLESCSRSAGSCVHYALETVITIGRKCNGRGVLAKIGPLDDPCTVGQHSDVRALIHRRDHRSLVGNRTRMDLRWREPTAI
jgi:hypothetical protein